jgi:hypothetical protein
MCAGRLLPPASSHAVPAGPTLPCEARDSAVSCSYLPPPSPPQRRRGSRADPVSEDDLLRAIEKLSGLGSGFGAVRIGAKQFVRSVPTELSTDSNALIQLAEVGAGAVRLGGSRSLEVLSPALHACGCYTRGCHGSPGCVWAEKAARLSHSRLPRFTRPRDSRLHGFPCSRTPLPPIPTCPHPSEPLPSQERGGYFSLADALGATGWQEARVREALGVMAREELLLIDDLPGELTRDLLFDFLFVCIGGISRVRDLHRALPRATPKLG